MSFNKIVISESFSKAKPILKDVVTKFYEFLTKDYPQTLPMFQRIDINKMKTETASWMIDLVDIVIEKQDHSKLESFHKILTERQINEEKVDWGIHAFLRTFEYFFGDDWQGELSDNWVEALEDLKKKIFVPKVSLDAQEVEQLSHIPKNPIVPKTTSKPTTLPTMFYEQNEETVVPPPKIETAPVRKNDTIFAEMASSGPAIVSEPPKVLPLHKVTEIQETFSINEITDVQIKPGFLKSSERKDRIIPTEEKVVEVADEYPRQPVDLFVEKQEIHQEPTIMESNLEFKKSNHTILKIDSSDLFKNLSFDLPDDLKNKIHEAAENLVKEKIKIELERAMEIELKRYLENGIGDLLKKSS